MKGPIDNLFDLSDFVPDGGYPYPWPPVEEESYEIGLDDETLFEMDEYKNSEWCVCPKCHKKVTRRKVESNFNECPYCGESIFFDLLY